MLHGQKISIKKAFKNHVQLVKQSFRVHKISPHAAKKEKKKAISSKSPETVSLTFSSQQSRRNQDFTINKLIIQIKTVVFFLFTTGMLKGYHPYVFNLCSSITGKNYTICFFNFTPKQKRSYLEKFTLSLADDCSD